MSAAAAGLSSSITSKRSRIRRRSSGPSPAFGSSLGITTTAEGVETIDQLNQVGAEGCTEVQGYFFSPPRRASELAGVFNEVSRALAGRGRSAA